MLTDEELATMIAGRYGDVALAVPLDDVVRRGDSRRRTGRVVSGIAVAAAVLLVGGAVGWITSGPTTSAPTARGIQNDCDRQYSTMIAGRSDREDLPAKLPAPIIDMRSGAGDFRLYAGVGPAKAHDQLIFDCSHTVAGTPSAHLTVTLPDEYPNLIGVATDLRYYRDYLPDGSGALVGWLQPNGVAVRVTAADGATVPTTVAHGYFVAWSPRVDVDGATVRVYDGNGATVQTLSAPNSLSGTFDDRAFLAVCRGLLGRASGTGGAYRGDQTPVLEEVAASANQAVAIYLGNVTAVCRFAPSHVSATASMQTYAATPSNTRAYGWQTFLGDAGGFVTGMVPTDTTDVRIVGPDGTAFPAATSKGAFAAWITGQVFESSGTRLVATSPAGPHTYPNPMSPLK